MAVNVVREYRKIYIGLRRKGEDMDAAHTAAVFDISWQLLEYSSVHGVPISKRDMNMLKDMESNPHYRLLLEEILNMDEAQQKEFLQQAAKVPQLRLVK